MIEKCIPTQISNMLTHYRFIASSQWYKILKKFKIENLKKIAFPKYKMPT